MQFTFCIVHGQMDEPLLDLSPLDNTTINTTAEYFDMDQVIFLSNMTEFITQNGVSTRKSSCISKYMMCREGN